LPFVDNRAIDFSIPENRVAVAVDARQFNGNIG
jgi:hypothetical protein